MRDYAPRHLRIRSANPTAVAPAVLQTRVWVPQEKPSTFQKMMDPRRGRHVLSGVWCPARDGRQVLPSLRGEPRSRSGGGSLSC